MEEPTENAIYRQEPSLNALAVRLGLWTRKKMLHKKRSVKLKKKAGTEIAKEFSEEHQNTETRTYRARSF